MTDVTVKAGNDHNLTLVYKDNDGIFVDITGGSARMMVKANPYTPAVITKTADIDGPVGKLSFDFVPADTESLLTNQVKQVYLFDVELTKADGKRLTLVSGKFIVEQTITRG